MTMRNSLAAVAAISGFLVLAATADTHIPKAADFEPVDSRVFDGVLYDADESTLMVLYDTGEIVKHDDVPASTYEEFKAHPLKGGYYKGFIRKEYPRTILKSAMTLEEQDAEAARATGEEPAEAPEPAEQEEAPAPEAEMTAEMADEAEAAAEGDPGEDVADVEVEAAEEAAEAADGDSGEDVAEVEEEMAEEAAEAVQPDPLMQDGDEEDPGE